MRGLAGAAAAWIVSAQGIAQACSVCTGGANDQTQAGFLMGTLLLSTLPLLLVGGLVLWIRRRARQMAAQDGAGVIRTPEGHRSPPRLVPGSPQPSAR